MIDYLSLFIFLSLLAEVLGTVGGFGSSVFFVPMAGQFLDFQSVLGITAIFHLSSNIVKIGAFRKGLNWKLALTMGIPAIVLVALGAWISQFIQTDILETGLSVLLILSSILFLLFDRLNLKGNTGNAALGGAVSGFLAGLLGTGGAIRGLALTSFGLGKEVFITTSAVIDLGIDISRSIVYFNNGYVHKEDLYLIPILLVVSIAGTYIGKNILERISQPQFKKVTLVLILLIGMGLLTKSVILHYGNHAAEYSHIWS